MTELSVGGSGLDDESRYAESLFYCYFCHFRCKEKETLCGHEKIHTDSLSAGGAEEAIIGASDGPRDAGTLDCYFCHFKCKEEGMLYDHELIHTKDSKV